MSVLEGARESARELTTILREAAELLPQSSAEEVRAASEAIEARLAREGVTVVVLGSERRATLFDRVLGARVFADAARGSASTTTWIRAASELGYHARRRDGTVETFAANDRRQALAQATAVAQDERDTAARLVADAEARPSSAPSSTPTPAPARSRDAPWTIVWRWIVRLIALLFGRRSAPALPAPSLPEVTRVAPVGAMVAKARLERATAMLERAQAAARAYEAERTASFIAALRARLEAEDIEELTIDVPSASVPAGVALVDLPGLTSADRAERARARDLLMREVDGCVLVTDAAGATPVELKPVLLALRPVVPRVVDDAVTGDALRELCEAALRDKPLVLAARASSEARRCIAAAVEHARRAEATCRVTIAALEDQRVPAPADFKAASLARMAKPIDEAAGRVVRAVVARLQDGVAGVRREWRTSIESAKTRAEIESRVHTINDDAQRRLGAVLERTSDALLAEMQRASDTMQIAGLDELYARYELTGRISFAGGGAPVISDVTSEDLAELRATPLGGALDAFEGQRVGYGVGGAAAGALLGTLIVPGIGTAIGAFIGTFAGFLKGPDSLRRDCLAKLDACLDDAEGQIVAQLEGSRARVAEAVRASIDDALGVALSRLERAIRERMDQERALLEAERARLEKLARLQWTLGQKETRFAELARSAGEVSEV